MFGVKFSSSTNSSNWPPELAQSTVSRPTPVSHQTPIESCNTTLGSIYLQIPKPGTEKDDHNPQRIQPRNLFDLSVGHDNVFHGDRYKVSARLSVINVTNKEALYNFLSTFSGTHYVTPRTITATIGFHF